jgi:protein-disulfide isomerase
MFKALLNWCFRPSALRFWTGVGALALSTTLFLVACQPIALSAGGGSDADFEAKVLDVIRKNPQVILESVSEYNQQQAQKQRELRQNFARDSKTNPQKVIGTSPTLGKGKVLLVEFSDFQCPYCSRAIGPLKQFLSEYPDRVTLTFKHFPLRSIHPEAMPAAQAAWAAQQQGKFWEYHDELFANQAKLSNATYSEIAKKLGLDLPKFERERNSDAAKKAVSEDATLAESLGLEGTPSFLMGGEPVQQPSVDGFKAALERASK